jgi:Asp-tRNA(Asn)/Glu-tRNA(Gln) amidotransferase C subunit
MGKIMPLELLSSIKGARSSDAVDELFSVIKRAVTEDYDKEAPAEPTGEAIYAEDLRSDEVAMSPDAEIEIIIKNFPIERNGFLVVPKVIED